MIWKKVKSFDNKFFMRFNIECNQCGLITSLTEILTQGNFSFLWCKKCNELDIKRRNNRNVYDDLIVQAMYYFK